MLKSHYENQIYQIKFTYSNFQITTQYIPLKSVRQKNSKFKKFLDIFEDENS